MADALGDRMKAYEDHLAGVKLIPLLPVMARLDGRSFSRFTRNLDRPYDRRLTRLMKKTATFLCEETNANMAYTQSDEISLTWLAKSVYSEIFFGGRVQKMVSTLAAMATGFFNQNMSSEAIIPEIGGSIETFDCRVWNVPNRTEGANAFLWRELDATKNSISSAARSAYSHSDLMNKNGDQMQDMLHDKGINWNEYPASFKRGTFIQRRRTARTFTPEEIKLLPHFHEAHRNPGLEVERSTFVALDMPPFSTVINREDVIYEGDEPALATNGVLHC